MKIPEKNIGMQMEKALSSARSSSEVSGDKKTQSAEQQQGSGFSADRVDISDKARDVQRLNQFVAEVPDVREAKVEALQRQIAAQTYGADGKTIAEKLVKSTLLDKVL